MNWNLRDGNAILETDSFKINACLQEPTPNIRLSNHRNGPDQTEVSIRFQPLDTKSPSWTKGLALQEAYVRQADVIASYPQRAPSKFGYQLDLRRIQKSQSLADDFRDLIVLEVWLSVQTSLLDSQPQFRIDVAGNLFSELKNGLWLDSNKTAAVLVHPMDLADCEIATTNGSVADSELKLNVFGRFMEKGVIRRMRFRIMVASSSSSPEFWLDGWNEFSESPLPLTT